MSQTPKKLDVAAARARLNGTRGREFWRNLEELAGTPEFEDLIERWRWEDWRPAPASLPNRSRPTPSNRKN